MSLHAPREKRVGIAFNAFLGSRAGRFPRRSAKLLKVFDLNATGKPRRVRRKISPNCIETLAVMTFLRSPHCATCPIPLPRTVCTLSLCRLAVFSPSLSVFFGVSQKKNSWQRDTSYIIKVDRLALDLSMGSRRSSKSPALQFVESQLKLPRGFWGFWEPDWATVWATLAAFVGLCLAFINCRP